MRKIFLQIVFGCAAFLITLFICDIYIRTSYIENVSLTEFDDKTGKVRRKNIDYLMFNEGFGIGKINEYGYLGEANPPMKPQNTIRIALIGDSYVESYHVFERHYFGTIARDKLSGLYPNKQFEFLNFGWGGFNIKDMYACQKNIIDSFSPDYILYFISSDDLDPEYSDELRPRIVLKNDSLLISSDFNPEEAKKFKNAIFLMHQSAILNMINECRKRAMLIPVGSIILEKVYTWFFYAKEATENSNRSKSGNYIEPITRKIIESLDPEKVVIINRGDAELPLEFINLCHNRGLLYFDLYPLMDQLKETGKDPHTWSVTKKRGHWNHYAHQVIGKEIAKIIRSKLTIKNNKVKQLKIN